MYRLNFGTATSTGSTEGAEYVVRVIAVNDEGDGSPSAEATGMLRQTTPPQMVMPRVNSANLALRTTSPSKSTRYWREKLSTFG